MQHLSFVRGRLYLMMTNLSHSNLLRLDCAEDGYSECYIAFWMWRILPPMFIVLGTIGNALNFVVLLSKNLRRRPTSVYLMLLAGSDMISLWTGMLHETLYSVFGISMVELTASFCSSLEWFIYTTGIFSVWLLALVTIERAISTKAPYIAHEYFTSKKALVVSSILLSIVAGLCSHLIYGNHFKRPSLHTGGNQTETTLRMCVHVSVSYTVFYNTTWATILSTAGTVLPTSIIIIGNLVIAVALRNRKVAPIPVTRVQRSLQKQTKMLVVVTVAILISTFSFSIYKLLIDYTAKSNSRNLARFQLYTVCTYSIVWLNFSCNFILYCTTGVLFRRECRKVLRTLARKVCRGRLVCTSEDVNTMDVTVPQ